MSARAAENEESSSTPTRRESIFGAPSSAADFKRHAFVCNSPDVPSDVYFWETGKNLKRITTINPWVSREDRSRNRK